MDVALIFRTTDVSDDPKPPPTLAAVAIAYAPAVVALIGLLTALLTRHG